MDWTEEPILTPISPPPPGLVEVRGAQLVRIYDGPGATHEPGGRPRPDGGREAVVLARARIPCGGQAVLLAWTSYARLGGRGTALARYGWYRFEEQRVRPQPRPRTSSIPPDAQWHGWHELSELHQAILRAAAMLPEQLRADALTPAPDPA